MSSLDVVRLAHELKGPPKPRELSETAEAILRHLQATPERTGRTAVKMSAIEHVGMCSPRAAAHALYELQDMGRIGDLVFGGDGIACQVVGKGVV
jgi:hypothetical protein